MSLHYHQVHHHCHTFITTVITPSSPSSSTITTSIIKCCAISSNDACFDLSPHLILIIQLVGLTMCIYLHMRALRYREIKQPTQSHVTSKIRKPGLYNCKDCIISSAFSSFKSNLIKISYFYLSGEMLECILSVTPLELC